MSADLTPHAPTIAAWLRYVHGHAIDAALPAYAVLSYLDERDRWVSGSFTLTDLDDAAERAAGDSAAGRNVYHRLTLLDEPLASPWKRGTSRQTRWATHIAADVDIAGDGHVETNLPPDLHTAVDMIDATLRPSAIVASGGGLYPIYRLAEPLELVDDDTRRYFRNIAQRLDHALRQHGYHVDATAHDLARVNRPPGVTNCKRGRDVRPVTLLRPPAAGAGDYTLLELDATLPELPRKQARQARPKANTDTTPTGTPRREPAPKRERTGRPRWARWDRRPWDVFAELYTIDEVLAADTTHEWEELEPVDGKRRWLRAGSSSTYSIKEGDDGRIIIHSATVAADLGVLAPHVCGLWQLACRLGGIDPDVLADTGRVVHL